MQCPLPIDPPPKLFIDTLRRCPFDDVVGRNVAIPILTVLGLMREREREREGDKEGGRPGTEAKMGDCSIKGRGNTKRTINEKK